MRGISPTPLREEVARLDALCDDVLQRLFVTGVGIDAIVGQLADRDLAQRLAQHVAELDDTIEEIRIRNVGLRAD